MFWVEIQLLRSLLLRRTEELVCFLDDDLDKLARNGFLAPSAIEFAANLGYLKGVLPDRAAFCAILTGRFTGMLPFFLD